MGNFLLNRGLLLCLLQGTCIAIAGDRLVPSVYPEETKWMLRRDLYERIADNDSLLEDSLMAAFYANYDNTNFADFYYTQRGMQALGELSAADQAQVDAVNSSIAQLMSQITEAQLQLADSTISEQDKLLLIANMSDWKAEIETQRASINSILGNNKAESMADAADLQAQNALTTATEQYELNERQVNDIYLATIGQEIYTLSQAQQSQLLAIAYQCPLAGGQAVYHARGLYAMVSDSIVWNDDSLCTAAGLSFRHGNTNNNITHHAEKRDISYHPNPATDELTIVFPQITAANYRLAIYDILGKECLLLIIPENTSDYHLDVSTLTTGVYTIKVSTIGQIESTHKLIINR